MRAMRILAAVLLLLSLPVCALAGEGDPLLSVDDLLTLEDSYSAFLSELEALIVERGLLSQEERAAWRDAQMGDFYQNGGYGSVLVSYMPGMLSYVREEDTLLVLTAQLEGGYRLEAATMRRYTPENSSLSGLLLTLSVYDAGGMPVDAQFTFTSTSGVFLKWDALMGSYTTIGASATSGGETVVFSDQTPVPDAKNPVISIGIADVTSGEPLPGAALTLRVDGTGYVLDADALQPV